VRVTAAGHHCASGRANQPASRQADNSCRGSTDDCAGSRRGNYCPCGTIAVDIEHELAKLDPSGYRPLRERNSALASILV